MPTTHQTSRAGLFTARLTRSSPIPNELAANEPWPPGKRRRVRDDGKRHATGSRRRRVGMGPVTGTPPAARPVGGAWGSRQGGRRGGKTAKPIPQMALLLRLPCKLLHRRRLLGAKQGINHNQ